MSWVGRSRFAVIHYDNIFMERVRKTTEFSIDKAGVQGEMIWAISNIKQKW
jgi:hypothetical protein